MKIGLALSGGGVLGAAHLGLLEEIEKNKIEVKIVGGVSSGAIVGALYAAGGVKKIDDFLYDLSAEGLFDKKKILFNALPDKFFTKIESILQKHLPENFYDLPINFFCLATNFVKGRPVEFSNGNLVEAVMASSAYPGVFSPRNIEGKSLIDGGVACNLPVSTLKDRGADFIIASSLYNIEEMEQYEEDENNPGRLLVARRALDIMQQHLADYEKKQSDFCFEPPVKSFSWYNFDKMDEIRQIGKDYAKEIMPNLIKKISSKKDEKHGFWKRLLGN